MRTVKRDGPSVAVAERLRATAPAVEDRRRYEFLTPVFGGGVRVEGARKHADPVTAVRAPSIRGQLRFWWRAVNPRGCATPEALRRAEAEVFGAASEQVAGVLDVAVTEQPASRRDLQVLLQGDKFKAEAGMESLAYGAFPLRDPDFARHGVLHEYRGAWSVVFRYREEIRDDVDAALWAWAHFGGLGGRTRRGFGAIRQVEGAALLTIEAGWARWIERPGRPNSSPWPVLPANRARALAVMTTAFRSGVDAQKELLKSLRYLRQGKAGRNPTSSREPNRPGRSYWPEPDAIRAVTGTSAPEHRERVTRVDAFPRAAFGMPIVFHFKDRGDPRDMQLKPEVGGRALGRLASPLVLRPHARDATSVEALALVLVHPPPESVALDGAGGRGKALRWKLTPEEAHALRPMQENGEAFADPLLRFLHLVRTGR